MSAARRHVRAPRLGGIRRVLIALAATAALATWAPAAGAAVEIDGGLDVPEPTSGPRAAAAAATRGRPLPDLSTMTLPELQAHAVRMQRDFVRKTQAYEAAVARSEEAKDEAAEALDESLRANAEAEQARSEFVATVNMTYQEGLGDNKVLRVLAEPDALREVLEEHLTAGQVADFLTVTYEELAAIQAKAELAAERAEQLRVVAVEAAERAEVLLDEIQGRAAKVLAAANRALASSAGGTRLYAGAEQEARNKAVLDEWQRYLGRLDKARVVPPAVSELADLDQLPRGLEPLVGADGAPLPGVAAAAWRSTTLTVLPRETIEAVSRVFAALGKPYVAHSAGPESYDCSGLVSAAWTASGQPVPATDPVDLYRDTMQVPLADAQVGDLVFFSDGYGVQHVGVNLGGELMIAADGSGLQVAVQPFPATPFAVTRPTLPAPEPNDSPDTDPESWTRCGSEAIVSTGAAMLHPIKEGQYTLAAGYGQVGLSGRATGLGLVAPAGTPVLAAKSGVVTVEESDWAGPHHVTIDHGHGMVTSYAHLKHAVVKTGDNVEAGTLIGAVGDLGDAAEAHLHFETLIVDTAVDPMLFLTAGAGPSGWGGYPNGMIPISTLCPLAAAPGHRLRCDAAAAWDAMALAYSHDMGTPLCITDSYRGYPSQVRTFAAKPALAAIPGTSNHGWALAVDLCGGIERFGTPQHAWMVANAPMFGWGHPAWARQGGGREEPWHWEFGAG